MSVEVTAEVGKDTTAQGEGAKGCERKQTQCLESGQSGAAGILQDGGGAPRSLRLKGEGKHTHGVGFREDAAERKLWKTGLAQRLSNSSVYQEVL